MCKKALIFCGPTINSIDASEYLDAIYLPPAQQGDVYKYYKIYSPEVIGIIDGFFENKPSPWHKEILYVMSKGVHVVGSSSMGALRASELSDFGMLGIGNVYEAYKEGAIIDDDEVAVVHGPAELKYPALSEAMVNMRETLINAKDSNIIDDEIYNKSISILKNIFYKNRSYNFLINELLESKIDKLAVNSLSEWLSGNKVNVKKSDAIKLLQYINNFSRDENEYKKSDYFFEKTLVWTKMKRLIDDTIIDNDLLKRSA